MTQTKKKPDLSNLEFEKALQRLEEIVRTLEANKTTLSESLQLFEEGVKLTAHCNALLDKAEQQVSMLVKGEDGTMKPAPMPPL
ncbi:MAG: exodeoxyribonuclease VII small subunit [Clostridia bacterium]|nr:exodeoxyribonuclease VII small subunit [Clostridia bacterium]